MSISIYVPQVPASLIPPPELCPTTGPYPDTVANIPDRKVLSHVPPPYLRSCHRPVNVPYLPTDCEKDFIRGRNPNARDVPKGPGSRCQSVAQTLPPLYLPKLTSRLLLRAIEALQKVPGIRHRALNHSVSKTQPTLKRKQKPSRHSPECAPISARVDPDRYAERQSPSATSRTTSSNRR